MTAPDPIRRSAIATAPSSNLAMTRPSGTGSPAFAPGASGFIAIAR